MPKSVDDVIEGALLHAYDPVKAHEYYMRTRELKGRKRGAKVIPLRREAATAAAGSKVPPSLQAQVTQLTARLSELQARLRELLSDSRESSAKSDGKKTAAEKAEDARESKQYRDKHKTEIAQKRKREASKSGGGGSSSGGGSSISSMSESEVRAAIARTRSNLQAAVAKARAASRGTA